MRINPNGCTTSHAATVLGIIFGLWCSGLAAFVFITGSEIIIAVPLIVTAAVFIVGGAPVDLTHNRKARAKTQHREHMLRQVCVSGRITETDKYVTFLKKKYRKDLNSCKASRREYVFKVSFTDPHTGAEREVTSEEYNFPVLHERPKGTLHLERCFDDEYADVYVSPEG